MEPTPEKFQALAIYVVITLAASAPILMIFGVNRSIWRNSGMVDYTRVVIAVSAVVLVSVVACFFVTRLNGVARSMPFLQGMFMVFLLIAGRVLVRQRHTLRRQGGGPLAAAPAMRKEWETVLVVGDDVVAELYLQTVEEFAGGRVRVAGLLGSCDRHTGRLVRRCQVLGTPEEAGAVLRALDLHGVAVDRIVVTVAFSRLSRQAQSALIEVERTSSVKLDLFAEKVCLGGSGGDCDAPRRDSRSQAPGVLFSFGPDLLQAMSSRRYWRVKRAADFVCALVLSVLLFPVIALAAALVAMDIGPNVIFWQQRPGLGGRPFRLYKFCTMGPGHDLNGRRLSDGERLSVIGRFLRRTRLDELPQLYNVLVGDMSFVGPRPLLPVDQSAAYAARLMVRPGITGWAQVNGGRRITAMDKAALDVWYVANASFALDLRIMARTAAVLLFGETTNQEAMRQAWIELEASGVCVPAEDGAAAGETIAFPRKRRRPAGGA